MFTRVERGGRKKEEEDFTCHRNFCDGSRTEDFFFTFSVPENGEKWEFFGGWRGGERGKKRTLGMKPQGPVLIILFCF